MNAPKRVLVIVTRRIGDVLLATPLIRTIREAWPKTSIDVLVYKNTEGVIVNNPDIEEIITIEEDSTIGSAIKLIYKIFRRYDISFSTLAGDRQVLYSWLAGKSSVGLVPDSGFNHFWKRCLLSRWAYFDNLNTHTVLMNLKLAELGLSIETLTEIRDYVKKLENWQIENISKIYRHGEIDFRFAPYCIGPVASRMAELEGTKLGGFLSDVIVSWLRGLPLLTVKLRANWRQSPEELISVIYSRIQYLLPWGLYAMHRIVLEEAKRRSIVYNDEILKMAYLVDAGVPSFDALQLVNQNFERVDATRISNYYRRYRKDTTIIKWVNAQSTDTIIGCVRGRDNRRLDSDLFLLLGKLKTQ